MGCPRSISAAGQSNYLHARSKVKLGRSQVNRSKYAAHSMILIRSDGGTKRMQAMPQDEVQRGMMIAAAVQGAVRGPDRENSRWASVFGPNADPKLANKLFREDFAEYRRLKNLAGYAKS
jgi:hypothetical protein